MKLRTRRFDEVGVVSAVEDIAETRAETINGQWHIGISKALVPRVERRGQGLGALIVEPIDAGGEAGVGRSPPAQLTGNNGAARRMNDGDFAGVGGRCGGEPVRQAAPALLLPRLAHRFRWMEL